MPAVVKSSLKDKLEDDVLDLSLMQMDEVPVEELALVPKGTTVDLSNNLLVRLPENFPTLTHIIKLDLSKNRLEDLPEYFGQMKQLRHLDLYSNQISRLPVSFCQLKNLKWLDLKGNPLVPALQQAAGPCITANDCSSCAKQVVGLMRDMQAQMELERQRIALEERKREEQRLLAENAERDRLRAEKKAAKAKKVKPAGGGDARVRGSSSTSSSSRLERQANGSGGGQGAGNGSMIGKGFTGRSGYRAAAPGQTIKKSRDGSSGGFWWSLVLVLVSVFLFSVGAAVSTVWVYTGGRLDQASIERALPVIARDAEALLAKASAWIDAFTREQLTPAWAATKANLQWLGAEWERRHKIVSFWLNENMGPTFCAAKRQALNAWSHAKVHLDDLYEKCKPWLRDLQVLTVKYAQILKVYLLHFLDVVYHQTHHILNHLQSTLHNLIQ